MDYTDGPDETALNILIGRPMLDVPCQSFGSNLFTGVIVCVRERYLPLADWCENDGRVNRIALRMNTRRKAPLGTKEVHIEVAAIEYAVGCLRRMWGDLPVYDNSGVCSHLAKWPASSPL